MVVLGLFIMGTSTLTSVRNVTQPRKGYAIGNQTITFILDFPPNTPKSIYYRVNARVLYGKLLCLILTIKTAISIKSFSF